MTDASPRTSERTVSGASSRISSDQLENPVTGERFTFTDTAASAGGALLAPLVLSARQPRAGGLVAALTEPA